MDIRVQMDPAAAVTLQKDAHAVQILGCHPAAAACAGYHPVGDDRPMGVGRGYGFMLLVDAQVFQNVVQIAVGITGVVEQGEVLRVFQQVVGGIHFAGDRPRPGIGVLDADAHMGGAGTFFAQSTC